MPSNNEPNINPVNILIWLSERIFDLLGLAGSSVAGLYRLATDKKEREKKNGGKGDWILKGEQFEKEMQELGEILQENIKYHSDENLIPDESLTPEQKKQKEIRAQILEEAGELLGIDPKTGIKTKREFEKYQQIKEYFLKDNLACQKRSVQELQRQKDDVVKSAEAKGLENPEIQKLAKELDALFKRQEYLLGMQEEMVRDRERRDKIARGEDPEEDYPLEDEIQKVKDQEEKKAAGEDEEEQDLPRQEEVEKPKQPEEDLDKPLQIDEERAKQDAQLEEDKKEERERLDTVHHNQQGAAKGLGNAAVLEAGGEAVKEAVQEGQAPAPNPYAMDEETLKKEQDALRGLMTENELFRRLRRKDPDSQVLPVEQLPGAEPGHAKQVEAANECLERGFSVSDKQSYDTFMALKGYFLEQNTMFLRDAMHDNLSRQETIRATLLKESQKQREDEDKADRQKREGDPAVKETVRKSEKDIEHEVRKEDEAKEQRKKEEVKKDPEVKHEGKPEAQKGPAVKPPGIQREPMTFAQLQIDAPVNQQEKKEGEKKVGLPERLRQKYTAHKQKQEEARLAKKKAQAQAEEDARSYEMKDFSSPQLPGMGKGKRPM